MLNLRQCVETNARESRVARSCLEVEDFLCRKRSRCKLPFDYSPENGLRHKRAAKANTTAKTSAFQGVEGHVPFLKGLDPTEFMGMMQITRSRRTSNVQKKAQKYGFIGAG